MRSFSMLTKRRVVVQSPASAYCAPRRCVVVRPSLQGHRARSLSVSSVEAVEAVEAAEPDVVITQFPAPSAGAFLPDKRSFREEHRIRGYEVNPDQRASVVTIANLLQEVAGNHAVGMWGRTDEGFASLPMMGKNVLFVMTRLQVRMFKYPKWGDIVGVETYFTEEGRLAFRREWKVTDATSGAEIGVATSTWVTIDMDTRRLVKLPDTLRKRFLRFSPSSYTHVLPPDETKRKLPDMELPGQVQGPPQVARRSDMDMNGHINNVTYMAWALESVPEQVYGDFHLREIEMDFKAECTAGNTVEAHCNFIADPQGGEAAAANGAANGGSAATAGQVAEAADVQSLVGGREALQLLHVVQKCDADGCTELVRARTSWRRGRP